MYQNEKRINRAWSDVDFLAMYLDIAASTAEPELFVMYLVHAKLLTFCVNLNKSLGSMEMNLLTFYLLSMHRVTVAWKI